MTRTTRCGELTKECGVVYLLVFAIAVPETARKVVGNGSIPPTAWWSRSVLNEFAQRRAARLNVVSADQRPAEGGPHHKLRFPNPLKTLLIIGEKDCAVILLYNAFIYASWYTVTANLANLLVDIYGLNTLQIGLCYV